MMLSHDAMEISHAPSPFEVIWENVAIPKSQIMMRNFIVNIGKFVTCVVCGRGQYYDSFVYVYVCLYVCTKYILNDNVLVTMYSVIR